MFRWMKIVVFFVLGLFLLSAGGSIYLLRQMRGQYEPRMESPDLSMFLPIKVVRLPLRDGTVAEGWLLRQEIPRPLIWIIPDMNEFHSDWSPWMSTLFDWGYSVVIFNLRGHRPSEGIFTADHRLMLDAIDTANHLINVAGLERRWGILGHGMGARLAVEALCAKPPVRILMLEDPVLSYTEHLIMDLDYRWRIGLIPTLPWWRFMYYLGYQRPDLDEKIDKCFSDYGQDRPHALILHSPRATEGYVTRFYQRLGEPKEMVKIPNPATFALSEADQRRYRNLLKRILDSYLPIQEEKIHLGQAWEAH